MRSDGLKRQNFRQYEPRYKACSSKQKGLFSRAKRLLIPTVCVSGFVADIVKIQVVFENVPKGENTLPARCLINRASALGLHI